MLHVSCIIIVVLIQFFQGFKLSKFEISGILLAISGGLLLTQNSSEKSREMSNGEYVELPYSSMMLGNLIALLGSSGGIMYYHNHKKIGKNLSVSCSCFYQSFMGFILLTIFSMLFESTEFFSMDDYNGIFGLFSKKYISIFP